MTAVETPEAGIAVIGLACRFPGARDAGELWRNLENGVESITVLSEAELRAAGVGQERLDDPAYVRAAAVLDDVEGFDAGFFGFSAREAEILDPQQRLLLECAWEALEHAGYDAARIREPVGVYASAGVSTYLLNNLWPNRRYVDAVGARQVLLGNDKDFLATMIAYKLDLGGPAVTVQTACSSSLVAVHVACQALHGGECAMALAGGVAVRVPHRVGYRFERGLMSPDGHCRAFDATASGIVGGSGAAVVVLKPLADALADGDTVLAVIRGSAVNNDGAGKVAFTAPNVGRQAAVIAEALAVAGTPADSIGYVETHGAGTPLGDPIEVAALTQAFREQTGARGFCAIGSVKTNVGHLDAAAGVAGLVKTVLALERGAIPPSLHFERPNPEIDFAASPFFVNDRLRPWPAGDSPRRAGVSSFGLGGTNAHVVLEEAPPAPAPPPAGAPRLLVLSARTPDALEEMTDRLADHLAREPAPALDDVAHTLQAGRRSFRHRRALLCRHRHEAVRALWARRADEVLDGVVEVDDPPVAFLFPGQGAQHVGMGRGLYRSLPRFRDAVDRCCDLLVPALGRDLRDVLYPASADHASAPALLDQTAIGHPALFTVSYALAELWRSWGVTPAAVAGHSVGEYVAACQAGILSLEDALELVAERGRLMQAAPPGAMLSVALGEAAVRRLLDEDLALAAVNAPDLCVVSGPAAAVERLRARLAEADVECRLLRATVAGHSPLMREAAGPFAELVAGRALSAPTLPLVSGVSGTWMTPSEATDPGHWAAQLLEPVRFMACVEELLREPGRVLLEVGPGRMLSTLARQCAGPGATVLASMRHPNESPEDETVLLRTAGQLWLAGVPIDWAALPGPERPRRVPLPAYPFQRQRYWVEPPAEAGRAEAANGAVPAEPGGGSRAAIPAAQARPALEARFEAPATALEEALAAIWQELLGVEPVGRHDHFLDLGGHSLLATRLTARIREACGVDLPLRAIFEHPTVAGLAGEISALRGVEDEAEGDDALLARLLDEVGSLSADEVAAELGDGGLRPGEG